MDNLSEEVEAVTQSTRRRLLQTLGIGAGIATFGGGASATGTDRVFVHPNGGQSQAAEALGQHGGAPFFVYENFEFVAGAVPGRNRRALAADRRVSFLEDDPVARATDRQSVAGSATFLEDDAESDQSASWGHTRIGAEEVDVGGADVDVAILDTGIEPSHEDLEVHDGRNFTDDGSDDEYEDRHGHGTHVAGIVAALDNDVGVVGVIPEANVHAVKVLGDDGSGYYSWIAAGIDWCISNGVEIINMSLGADAESSSMDSAIATAHAEGHFLVSSAGNSGNNGDGSCSEDNVTYPARHEDVVAVSSMDSDDDLASYSSVGPEVELLAPGSRIYSTDVGNSYSSKSGTSMAGPFVAGVAGLAWAVRGEAGPGPNEEVRATLAETAETVLGTCEEGNGLVDAVAIAGDGGDGDDSDDDGGDDGPVLDVETKHASDVDETAATLVGEVLELENVESVDVRFDYGVRGDGLEKTVDAGSLSTTESFDARIDGLDEDTVYEYRAVAVADDETETGSVREFATDGGDPSETDPTIERFDVETRQSGPWSRADVEWAVADEDGALATVTSELLDGTDVVDSRTSEVSGSTATGEHELRTRGDADAVRLIVADDAGNTTTATTGDDDGDDGDDDDGDDDDGDDDGTLAVETVGTSDVGETAATLEGEVTDTGDEPELDVRFEYGKRDGTLDATADGGTLSAAGTFDAEIDGLEAGTEYDFRAAASGAEETDRGDVVTFATTSDAGPSIDAFDVSTRNSGPWFRADAAWVVSHPDGGLATVETKLFDGNSVVDEESSQVDGSSASGEHGLRTRGEADSIQLTVTDTTGNSVSTDRAL